jgi:hypothetical protein
MEPIRVRNDLVTDDHELREISNDVEAIAMQFSELRFEPVPRGRDDYGGLSWRCRSYANANLIRGEELLRLCIQAINDGALIGTHLLARALDETLAAVVFAKRGLARLTEKGDPDALDDFLTKLLVGSRYMANRGEQHPGSHRVGAMIKEVDKYLRESMPKGEPEDKGAFGSSYAFCSEFVHPSLGSFAAYMRIRDGATVFEKPAQLQRSDLKPLLS